MWFEKHQENSLTYLLLFLLTGIFKFQFLKTSKTLIKGQELSGLGRVFVLSLLL